MVRIMYPSTGNVCVGEGGVRRDGEGAYCFCCGSRRHWRCRDTFLSAKYLVVHSYQVAWIYNWDITKKWFKCGKLDIIFSNTTVRINKKSKIRRATLFCFLKKSLLLVFFTCLCRAHQASFDANRPHGSTCRSIKPNYLSNIWCWRNYKTPEQ